MRDAGFCREAVERTVAEFGQLDILVNNAAFQQHRKRLEDVSEEQWDTTFRTNIYGYFYMAKAALAHMQRRRRHHQHRLDHRAARQQGTARLLRDEGRDPRVHQVAGAEPRRAQDSRQLRRAGAGLDAAQPFGQARRRRSPSSAPTPLKRPAQPEEIAPAFVFFASEADSSYITGEVLTLLGGETTAG